LQISFGKELKLLCVAMAHDNDLIPLFLQERPAICSGNRHLAFDLNLRKLDIDDDNEAEEAFLNFCQAISTLSNLQELSIYLEIHEYELRQVKPGTKTRKCLRSG